MKKFAILSVVLLAALWLPKASAQITNVVFSDDFEAGQIDTNNYAPDAPIFEGGKGDFTATQAFGELEFTGTVTTQYWAGTTLRLKRTFVVSQETNVIVSVDRLSEAGVGTSSRSALWILDATQKHYVLFADNRGENHWQYNRNIGEAGDNPTGGGTAIAAFDDIFGPYLDEGPHQMKAIVDGKTVKLYLDDVFGAEVKFPFSDVIFEIGSYARANGDTADTYFDNLTVESVGAATFSTDALTMTVGQTLSNLTVRIPPGVNATSAVPIRIVSSDPTLAIPSGATAGTLTLTFAAGATNVQTFDIQALASGGVQLSLTNDIGLAAGNLLDIVVIGSPGIQLQDDFSGTDVDTTKWQVDESPFEPGPGAGTYTETLADGTLQIAGTLDVAQYWGGAALKSVKTFTATTDLPLTVDVDRLSIDPVSSDGTTASTAARTGVFLANADRTEFVFFAQDVAESGWEVNTNPGNPTGGGTTLAPLSSLNDTNSHHMKLVADGVGVDLYLDGILGGRVPFPVTSGIYVELGSYSRALGDSVVGKFDNLKVEGEFPCITVSPSSLSGSLIETNSINITIPRLLTATAGASVTITSSNPSVLAPAGAVNGSLTLNFATGATNVQSVALNPAGIGTATLTLTTSATGTCVANGVQAAVTSIPSVVLTDDFSSNSINSNNWTIDSASLLTNGLATADSGVFFTNGAVSFDVTADATSTNAWPGFALATVQSFSASTTSPVSFEIDRVNLEYVLTTGTGAKQQTGIWVTDSTRSNYVFFTEYLTHDGTAGGWEYFRNIGQAGDTPVTGTGVSIPAFGTARFNDQENHHMKAEANGATVRLFLDGVAGAEVPFPIAQGIKFEFGTYVLAATDTATAVFDNAKILGTASTPGLSPLTVTRQTDGSLVIAWTGPGTLQSSDTLGATANWTNVTPAPSGTSYTVSASGQAATRFYRLRQ